MRVGDTADMLYKTREDRGNKFCAIACGIAYRRVQLFFLGVQIPSILRAFHGQSQTVRCSFLRDGYNSAVL